jgi:cysteine desulfurase / selenocysteine lyase
MPAAVLDAMTAYLSREATIGGYETADEAAARLDGVDDSGVALR